MGWEVIQQRERPAKRDLSRSVPGSVLAEVIPAERGRLGRDERRERERSGSSGGECGPAVEEEVDEGPGCFPGGGRSGSGRLMGQSLALLEVCSPGVEIMHE